LSVASITWLEEEPAVPVPEELAMLAELMKQAQVQAGTAYAAMAPRYQDAGWVGMRLAEILPLTLTQRQRCLEMDDALERLQFLRERLDIRQH
jgi:Lon protease-like protein